MKEGEGVFLSGSWQYFFMILMFVGIVLIFVFALGWWDQLWGFLRFGKSGDTVGAIVLLVIIFLFVWYVVKGEPHHDKGKKESSEH